MRISGEPVYLTIVSHIKKSIMSGQINPGDMLQSENELVSFYKASRVTVRKGLQILENEGFIYAWPGKGYFVAQPIHDMFSLRFSEDESGYDISYSKINVISPNKEIQQALQIQPNNKVIEICRVIKKGIKPVSYDIKYIPYDKGTPIIEEEIHYAVFPKIAAAKSAPFAFHTNLEITAELPSETIAKLLSCSIDTPLLVVYRTFIGQEGNRIGYGKKYMIKEYGSLKATSGYMYERSRSVHQPQRK